MMNKILKDTPCLFVRLVDYKKNDFIEEHIKVFNNNGVVWLLKMGKPAKADYIKEVIKNGGGLITKSTAKNGSKFYFCNILEYNDNEELIYPEYYNEIFENEYYQQEEIKSIGTWFKITNIIEISDEIVDKFATISTNRSLLECGKKFNQVSQMHIKATVEIEI